MADLVDVDDVSDEDFLKMKMEDFTGSPKGDTGDEEDDKTDELDTDLVVDPIVEDSKELEDTGDDLGDGEGGDADPEKKDTTDGGEVPSEGEPEKEVVIDYEAEYKKIMGGFKADGKEFIPKSTDDLIRMAQQGVNYHGKMVGIKPAKKALKTLENNGLLVEGELDFLIDLKNGKPEAIQKLIKKHNLDPADIDIDAEDTYVPGNYAASDEEVQLDEVLDSLSGSPNEARTLHIVTKQWDKASQIQAGNNPKIISVINEHITSGVYDKVSSAVTYERTMGRLSGMSDFEAYAEMGDKMTKNGTLYPVAPVKEVVEDKQPEKQVTSNKEKARKEAKRKAAPSGGKPAPQAGLITMEELVSMSDEEVLKLNKKKIGL